MTTDPFPRALAAILEERGMSQRELARLTERKSKNDTLSIWAVNSLLQGNLNPTERTMRVIAKSLNLDPSHFAEWRLMQARRELDPEQVPLARALQALDRFGSPPKS